MKDNLFDITIVGAGLVGLLSAIILSKRGYTIALIDKSEIKKQTLAQQTDARAIALSWSSYQILKAFDCWSEIKPHTKGIKEIQVSSQGHWGVTRLKNTDFPISDFGFVIENQHLHNALFSQAESNDLIHFYSHLECDSLQQIEKGGCQLGFKQSDIKFNSKLVFICDGAQSKTRDLAGFSTSHTNYQQTAITAVISGENTDRNTAFERFTQYGPLAMLPIKENQYGLIWAQKTKQSEALLGLNDEQFLTQLQQSFGYRLGQLTACSSRVAFPIHKLISNELVKDNYVVLGNTAHNLHPVAGQSLNLAIRDIAHLFDHLDELNHLENRLKHYQEIQLKDHKQVIQLGDRLVQLFSNNLPLLNHARSAGLALLDMNPPLKQNFAWRGMGYGSTSATAQGGIHG